jgi:hypothetical protein
MYKLILALAIMVTAGAVQLPLAFAAAPPQGGDPHGEFGFVPTTGDPHTSLALHGDPHLCQTTPTGGTTGGGLSGGKVVVTQC